MEGNFNKLTTSQWVDQDISYDIASVMQYSGYGFSTNGQPTITIIVDGVGTDAKKIEKSSFFLIVTFFGGFTAILYHCRI